MKTTTALLAVVAALVASPAMAADKTAVEARYTPALQACFDSPDGSSTMGMVQCIDGELKIQDAALNTAYRTLVADMTPDQKAGLLKAQRAWIAFRDADCAARYSPDWGTISTITANMCVLQRTVERTLELEAFMPDWAGPADSDPPGSVGMVPSNP